MFYPSAAARGIVLEGENSHVEYDSNGNLLTSLPPSLSHNIVLKNSSVFVSATANCTDCFCWAEAHGVHVDMPEASNSVVEINLQNSHIVAEAATAGEYYYDGAEDSCEFAYVYSGLEPGYMVGSSNVVGVYASSDMIINVDSTSSISGDWAVWQDPGLCVGWYHG